MLPLASGFDAVLCLYTSFGYFSDEDNLRQISEMVRVLRPGGRLLIDNQNPLLAHCRLPPDKPFGGAAGARFAEQFEYDTVSRRVFSRKQVRSPRGDRDYCFALRLYAREDLSAMLSERGMTTTGVYGDHDLRPYAPDSPRLILTACKPAAG
jgi:SAM-dependent methyltransferase